MKLVKEGYYGGLTAKVYELDKVEFRLPWGTVLPDSEPSKIEGNHLVFENGDRIQVSRETTIQSQLPIENPDVKKYIF